MKIYVPARKSFDCPEGVHRATFYDHFEVTELHDDKMLTFMRVQFEVYELSTPEETMLVAKNYISSLEQKSELRRMIEGWKGKPFLEAHTAKNFEFDLLKGCPADVKVVHVSNANFAKPYVCLAAVAAPGTLTSTGNTDQEKSVINVTRESTPPAEEAFETAIPAEERTLLSELAAFVVKFDFAGELLTSRELHFYAQHGVLTFNGEPVDYIALSRILRNSFVASNRLVLDGFIMERKPNEKRHLHQYTFLKAAKEKPVSSTTETKSTKSADL